MCSVDSSFEQADMFPDLIPDIVVRIWRAHQRHYRTQTRKPPTREQLRSYLEADPGKPASKSTINRARNDYPKLLTPWPIRRGQRPPWLSDPTVLDGLRGGAGHCTGGTQSVGSRALGSLRRTRRSHHSRGGS